GSLTEGLATDGLALVDAPRPQPQPPPVVDHRVHPPRAIALLTSAPIAAARRAARGTTVSDAPDAPRRSVPTFLSVRARTDLALAATLHRVATPALATDATVVANGAVPLTRPGRAPAAAVRGRGAV